MAGWLQAPDLPPLAPCPAPTAATDGTLELAQVLVEAADGDRPIDARRVRIRESELRGVVLAAQSMPGLALTDAILRDCGLSNLDAREGSIRRVALHRCRLVGFALGNGEVRDLQAVDCSLELASFAWARLTDVAFERVNLTEASFIGARLEGVEFVDCRLTGADFRSATLTGCAIRGSSLDGVVGVESLRGLRMPWSDIVASAPALAAALGIAIEQD